jgi:hypothetical protein
MALLARWDIIYDYGEWREKIAEGVATVRLTVAGIRQEWMVGFWRLNREGGHHVGAR